MTNVQIYNRCFQTYFNVILKPKPFTLYEWTSYDDICPRTYPYHTFVSSGSACQMVLRLVSLISLLPVDRFLNIYGNMTIRTSIKGLWHISRMNGCFSCEIHSLKGSILIDLNEFQLRHQARLNDVQQGPLYIHSTPVWHFTQWPISPHTHVDKVEGQHSGNLSTVTIFWSTSLMESQFPEASR